MITSKQAKDYRLKLGLSQNLIAKATGLSRPYLSNFEAGKFDPDHEFKETLEAFFIKQGIKIDSAEQNNPKNETIPKTNDNTLAEDKKVDMDNKVIGGIIVNTNAISYNEAQEFMEDNTFVSNMLITLGDTHLPIKKGFFGNSLDEEKLQNIISSTINQMALAYLRILLIRGESPLSMDEQDLPVLEDITNDNITNFSIADYLMEQLLDDDMIELNDTIEALQEDNTSQDDE
jgi:transcriptional regulator with XRE-family HTH domain